jgi:hypothetical protein
MPTSLPISSTFSVSYITLNFCTFAIFAFIVYTCKTFFSWFHTLAMSWRMYSFFLVIPRRLNFMCRRFGTLCLFHLNRSLFLIHFHRSCNQRPIKTKQSVSKRRHIKFRRRGITQKKEYNKKQRLLGYLMVFYYYHAIFPLPGYWRGTEG